MSQNLQTLASTSQGLLFYAWGSRLSLPKHIRWAAIKLCFLMEVCLHMLYVHECICMHMICVIYLHRGVFYPLKFRLSCLLRVHPEVGQQVPTHNIWSIRPHSTHLPIAFPWHTCRGPSQREPGLCDVRQGSRSFRKATWGFPAPNFHYIFIFIY